MNHECLKSRRKTGQQRRWLTGFGNTSANTNIFMGSNSTIYSSKIRKITRVRMHGTISRVKLNYLFNSFNYIERERERDGKLKSCFFFFVNSFANMHPAITN